MASASSKSAKNLFAESKSRLGDRVQINVNNMGSIARQIHRGSKAPDMLGQSAKNFAQAEGTMEHSGGNLQKMQLLLAQMHQQEDQIRRQFRHLPEIDEQIKDMQR
ncbi:hypothetical protein TCAL_02104 [Tigriopus californicus]|uniref:BLOC-1-related complex subunit 7 n=1 Tax=Tigriopus californicus TaxID=6832 RepID=A0A553ND72_TIGCA|nr:uncharacterized protein LOC131889561 [Tigriopus californicus]TRY63358.1 hypothetical protein TCAL_02104 [Tigriopus californicus]|eukprot:TCALIF_02104-PA protein Name:"Similar to UPF0693 protein C10orf32 homolog (Mus musculus)" AED:0.00 eAED:0.00 QI:0/-1/0/1/-1/1/1/0/105